MTWPRFPGSSGEFLAEESSDELLRLLMLPGVDEEAVVASAVEVLVLDRFRVLLQRGYEGTRVGERRQFAAAGAVAGAVRRAVEQQERRADRRRMQCLLLGCTDERLSAERLRFSREGAIAWVASSLFRDAPSPAANAW